VRAIGELWNIMGRIAGMDTSVAAILFTAFLKIYCHAPTHRLCGGPAFGQAFLLDRSYSLLRSGREDRQAAQPQEVFPRDLHGVRPAIVVWGSLWQFQQDGVETPE
jgi:hypothetical protein